MKNLQLFFFAFFLIVSFSMQAQAERTRVDITNGTFEPTPLAIPDFAADSAEGREIGRQVKEIIKNNLLGTGMFKILNESSFLEEVGAGQTPTFANWAQIGAQALVLGRVTQAAGGNVQIEFRLFDVLAGQQIAGTAFRASLKGIRRIAHQISDQTYSRLTGEGPYFDTRIVYVSESGSKTRRIKRLAIMDQDGANHQFITNGSELVLTPRFSPEDQKIIYLSFSNNKARVRTLEIETGRVRQIGNFPGMTFAPRYDSTGSRLLMSYALNGNTDIIEMNPHNGSQRNLTRGPAIETSPFYSPDEQQIVYTSDQEGTQNLYVMPAGGGAGNRITFGGGAYSAAAWSPRGDYIAFTKQTKGEFHIGVIRPDGSGERLLTSSYLDESPTWSPNGRVIMFTRQDYRGRSKLYSIDVTGYNERMIPTPADASDPTWSPLLK